jgi:hypothetical protein
MKSDFQENIWMIIKRSKYALNHFIKELKIRNILQEVYFAIRKIYYPWKRPILLKKNGVLEIFEEWK